MSLIDLKSASDSVGRAAALVVLSAVEVFMFLSTPAECQKFTLGVRILWFEISVQIALWESPLIH